jgi:transposase
MIADGKMDVQLDVSKASRVSRLEVIEGPTGRRNRSAAEKAKIAARRVWCLERRWRRSRGNMA